ncbi:MAG: GH92 family glycosyl hydrolase, partial [Bacteroidales bacterium]|nr:GH92 family glycosyl hydrolase [Candidatus Cryptobacteroides equifaecalis]
MKKILYIIAAASLALGVNACKQNSAELLLHPSDYVSTLVGTQSDYSISTGNLYPATTMPWGMNCWTPMTSKLGDGWTYRYDAHLITGFKQTHQPSPWINDYAYYSVMPLRDVANAPEENRGSWFSHKSETAKPYYYQVYLADHDVNAEMTASERGAVLRFTFPDSRTSGVVIDAADPNAVLTILDSKTIVGYTTNNHGGVTPEFKNYFVLVFDKPFADASVQGDEAVVSFDTVRGEQVCVRTASSFISQEQAMVNLREVAAGFDSVCEAAKARWDDVLGRIEVRGGSVEQMKTFYSCLYRSSIFPRKLYEIAEDGSELHYSPYNGQICKGKMYGDVGFWDVFRAQMPLINFLHPSIAAEVQEAMANIACENAFLPEWCSPGHRGCMVGNNSASVVADVYLKGIATDGIEDIYRALVYGTENVHPEVSSSGRLGHEYYNTLGYIPYNVGINENVARTLEYAYNDWCIALLAERMGRPSEEVEKFKARSENWRNVFDHETKLMRGKNLDGTFQSPFSPYKWGDAFTEGNAWHYTWSVFHNVEGLAEEMGGADAMHQMLDSVFVVPPIYDDSYYGFRIHEITEMQVAAMGNYAHGNQPIQHMIYLYNYIGDQQSCRKHVLDVMNRMYSC